MRERHDALVKMCVAVLAVPRSIVYPAREAIADQIPAQFRGTSLLLPMLAPQHISAVTAACDDRPVTGVAEVLTVETTDRPLPQLVHAEGVGRRVEAEAKHAPIKSDRRRCT
jgi:hypothetical protein